MNETLTRDFILMNRSHERSDDDYSVNVVWQLEDYRRIIPIGLGMILFLFAMMREAPFYLQASSRSTRIKKGLFSFSLVFRNADLHISPR
jgi:hypothetical protein